MLELVPRLTTVWKACIATYLIHMFYVAVGIVSIHTKVAHFRFTVSAQLVWIHEA
jgi:hypothetical protein